MEMHISSPCEACIMIAVTAQIACLLRKNGVIGGGPPERVGSRKYEHIGKRKGLEGNYDQGGNWLKRSSWGGVRSGAPVPVFSF